ncbi:hypothetical protein EMPS_07662 [Entomortierella parvispora]|uniref:Uncharacterized protein n=1 Tax=Entomortierella parvispora TaxID=205924 RepID=A0A9P3HEM0_9FUNG|nr:hypothetical protein EMPS_07662 [Entomortierella parvispora]
MAFTFTDINDPASHCVGLHHSAHLPFEYGQNSRTSLIFNSNNSGCTGLNSGLFSNFPDPSDSNSTIHNNSNNSNNNHHTGFAAAITAGPPEPVVDYVGALQYLFSQAKESEVARELCNEIELSLEPPVEAGVLQYLFRMKAIGRLQDWPLLFGEGNSFIVYLLQKMEKDEFPAANVNERTIWNDRRRETTEWVKERTKQRTLTMVAQSAF